VIHVGTAPDAPADRSVGSNRTWRIVALVAAFHVLIGLIGLLFFSTMGLAGNGVATCGGG